MSVLLLAVPAIQTILALAPIRRPFPVAVAGWTVSLPASELPLHLGLVVAATGVLGLASGPRTAADVAAAAGSAAICGGLAVVVARQRAAARVLDAAWAPWDAAGAQRDAAGVRPGADSAPSAAPSVPASTPETAAPTGAPSAETGTTTKRAAARRTPRLPTWLTALLRPWPGRPRSVRARRGLVYGPDPRANRCDLYTRAGGAPARGVLIHIHGGHFRAGGPSRESRAMLFDHARRGWAAISTTYHLSSPPESAFPQHLVDIKRLVAWVRAEGSRHGIPDGVPVVVAGSSAGAHLAVMTALTAGDPRFQPGFERDDTSLAGAIGLYGYYGPLGPRTKAVSDPVRHPADAAPPVAVIHGSLDAYTPVTGSRRLVRHLREGSANPVLYAELPGAQHGFDAVRTIRYLAVLEAIRRFTDPLAR